MFRKRTIAAWTWALSAWCCALFATEFDANIAWAQPAVQFPTAQPGASIYGSPPPTFSTPSAAIGPPPAFDPYAVSPNAVGGFGPPPATIPYNSSPYNSSPFGSVVPPPSPFQNYQNAPLAPNYSPSQMASPPGSGLPFDWQQGSYGFEGEQGYLVRAQRFLQELGFEHTWLFGDKGPEDFEIHRTDIYSTFAIPMPYLNTLSANSAPINDSPLLITPGFAVNFLEGPNGLAAMMEPEMPPRLYDAYLDVAWYPQFTQTIGAELGVRTGVWSDFKNINSDSIRLLGRGLAKVGVSPQLEILFGVVYLDRLRIKLLPAGGFYWRPTPEWDFYIVFPNPKIRKHFSTIGTTEWYWFVAGEYGGGSWTTDRSGFTGRVDINDIRISAGLEFETFAQTRGHLEIGFVFDREVIFDDGSMTPVFKPDDTVMVRGGFEF